jgi:hypothetical protein
VSPEAHGQDGSRCRGAVVAPREGTCRPVNQGRAPATMRSCRRQAVPAQRAKESRKRNGAGMVYYCQRQRFNRTDYAWRWPMISLFTVSGFSPCRA